MVEREEGTPSEREPETVEEVSERLRGLFQNVRSEHPEEFNVWQSAFDDVIDQAQIQYNLRIIKQRSMAEGSTEAKQRFHDESFFQRMKDESVLQKTENDAIYNEGYEVISRELYAMQVAFNRRGTKDDLGATIRELRRVKRSIRKL